MIQRFLPILGLSIAALVGGCYSSSPGVVRRSEDNPLVVVGAGEIEIGGGAYYYARYVIDARTQTCWFFAGDSIAALDCCALRKVQEAQEFITWRTPAQCAPAVVEAAPAPAPPPEPQPAPAPAPAPVPAPAP